jgi:hypothetical protein
MVRLIDSRTSVHLRCRPYYASRRNSAAWAVVANVLLQWE